MRITESCAQCLLDKQWKLTDDAGYRNEVKRILENRKESDTAPYMVYRFNRIYETYFGKTKPYGSIKETFNRLVRSMEGRLIDQLEEAEDPLSEAILYARIGNYIDFGAMDTVDPDTFLGLFENSGFRMEEMDVYESFLKACENAKEFLLLADNCGEIVLDKLMLIQLKKRFPKLHITVMVRGAETLNDATMEDAYFCGMDEVADLVSSGSSVAGTIYGMLSEEARKAFDLADVILSKGQGNYESVSGNGFHVFYLFLCKCRHFTEKFQVPFLTGMFVEEY